MSGASSDNIGILKGRLYRQNTDKPDEYIRDYGVFSFMYFVERLSVTFEVDRQGRFAICGDPRNPSSVFIASGVNNDDSMIALAEDYGLDINLID